jgi:hypothetical protein
LTQACIGASLTAAEEFAVLPATGTPDAVFTAEPAAGQFALMIRRIIGLSDGRQSSKVVLPIEYTYQVPSQ